MSYKVIYSPEGKAGEYSPLALNVYKKCSHRCKYCYCNGMFGNKTFFADVCEPKSGIVANVEKWIVKTCIDKDDDFKKQIQMSFVGDIFCNATDNNGAAIKILKFFAEIKQKTVVLTKGTDKAIKYVSRLFSKFEKGDLMLGTSLTFHTPAKSKEWESGASLPESRFAFLSAAKAAGIRTFVSFEPIIDVGETFKCIDRTLNDNSVDLYRFGKLNHSDSDTGPETKRVNDLLDYVIPILRNAGKDIYVKTDTRLDYYKDTARQLHFTEAESTAERWFL